MGILEIAAASHNVPYACMVDRVDSDRIPRNRYFWYTVSLHYRSALGNCVCWISNDGNHQAPLDWFNGIPSLMCC